MTTSPLLPWSLSKLAMYERCPASASYRHIQRLFTPPGPAAARGIEIHGSIENFLLKKQKFVHPAVRTYQPLFKRVRAKIPDVEQKLAVNEEWQPTEWMECWGRAVLDANTVEDDTLVVWEWKSGKVWDDHADQRKAYAVFAHAHWPTYEKYEVRTVYVDQRIRKKLTATHKRIERYREEFEERVGIMSVDTMFSPRPGFYCGWCGYSKYKGGPCKAG